MPKKIIIIGSKKVGKSTLFRQLTNQYAVNNTYQSSPIVNYSEKLINIENNLYKLIDTPALIPSPKEEIEKEVKKQIEELIKKSDLVCWIIDRLDESNLLLNKYLKKIKVPQILLVNKIDLDQERSYSYQILKPKHFLLVSTLYGTNLDQLTSLVIKLIPSPVDNLSTKEKKFTLLIFGPPNSGKSTLMNYLLQETRSVVTPLAGTTQEPVISDIQWQNLDFQLVDTAGITEQQKIRRKLWRQCDLAWAVIDCSLPLTKQILQITSLSAKYQKPLIIIINKIDLIATPQPFIQELRKRLKSLSYCPIISLSALRGYGINLLIKTVQKLLHQAQQKFSKKELNQTIEKMLINNPPKYFHGKQLKIYFVKHEPGFNQRFILFVNDSHLIHFSYHRYLINGLRQNLGLDYVPIQLIFKKSS